MVNQYILWKALFFITAYCLVGFAHSMYFLMRDRRKMEYAMDKVVTLVLIAFFLWWVVDIFALIVKGVDRWISKD